MSFLNREKVIYSIQALLLFLNISKETNSLSEREVEEFRRASLDLMELLGAEKITGGKGAFELNTLINKMNQSLSAPYPRLQTDSIENFVKGEVVAFEHYLNQELKANHLTIHQEAPLFNQSLMLWEQIGTNLSAQEGSSELSLLVEKLNKLLPEEEQYPSPE
ncbi:MAG: hypothetical protein JJU12_02065 [Chlamydiales bacterium]|nr:hypothetical protein [Chlamydiales bacterium]